MHSTNSLFGVSSTKPVTCWAWAIPEARPTYPTKLRLPLLRPTVPPRTSISSRIPSRYPQFRPPPTTASATNRNPRLIRLTPPEPHLPRLRVRCSCERSFDVSTPRAPRNCKLLPYIKFCGQISSFTPPRRLPRRVLRVFRLTARTRTPRESIPSPSPQSSSSSSSSSRRRKRPCTLT